jgi:hypothetical protein
MQICMDVQFQSAVGTWEPGKIRIRQIFHTGRFSHSVRCLSKDKVLRHSYHISWTMEAASIIKSANFAGVHGIMQRSKCENQLSRHTSTASKQLAWLTAGGTIMQKKRHSKAGAL